ncbi:hypothetical protein BpOF4_21189 (plasmid) [Alkalihalophilus pseudofirmus OF4]|uniref:Uncharacterized protein n=1 Tax=Alkalihalophilus pseudofirmus (strain ATCC BAA-2126 / JCM 17055 / OF4) TaxID=398511 RepID=D3G1K7_ALKPO|nr:hypothetical protein BpOF4_21189 [Alkalihalophilus pseudofirmus OF4]
MSIIINQYGIFIKAKWLTILPILVLVSHFIN